jgi:hypothetical protein
MYYMVLIFRGVCMVFSGLSFLSLGLGNMSNNCGDVARCVGTEIGLNWNSGSFLSIIRVNG